LKPKKAYKLILILIYGFTDKGGANMEEKRAYYAVIPADVRYNKNLKDKPNSFTGN
jgi:hypothetical protein